MRYLTAGESHGKGLFAIIEGFPAGLTVEAATINEQLKRRQMGYGRGGRMKIESDTVEFLSGVRWGKTIGSPITLAVWNNDHKNWTEMMHASAEHRQPDRAVTRPRPGHADLGGCLKRNLRDVRDILERSSARETAVRVALGALCKTFLATFCITVQSYLVRLGELECRKNGAEVPVHEINTIADQSDVRFLDKSYDEAARAYIDKTRAAGDTLGGIFEVVIHGVPAGIGDYTFYDRKLDARLAQNLMSLQAVKGVEVGMGFPVASLPGSQVHDAITYEDGQFTRTTNHAGGIEGGMSNGMPIVVRVAKKPIPTLYNPLPSVDIETKMPFKATIERSDVTAVPAASIIAEAICATVITELMLEKFGGDSMDEIKRNYAGYCEQIRRF